MNMIKAPEFKIGQVVSIDGTFAFKIEEILLCETGEYKYRGIMYNNGFFNNINTLTEKMLKESND